MARLPRSLLPDGIYHVTSRGVARALIYLDDDDRRFFLCLLAKAVQRYRWTVHAFCLMGNHYHLVLECTTGRALGRDAAPERTLRRNLQR
jgi:REP element-mobilizing transposase RayT